MIALLSTIGFLVDGFAFLFIAIKLYKPTKNTVGLSPKSFRGSLFWYFLLFAFFPLLLGITLLGNDLNTAALYGYVIGHIFLYVAYSLYIFAPFSIISPENKKIPIILSGIILISGLIISVINWIGYASGDYAPELGSNGVIIWNPPFIVFIYIVIVSTLIFGIFGAGLFFWHSFTTKNQFLKKRSRLLGLGFLILLVTGPPHDIPDIPAIAVFFADIFAAIGALIQGYALSLKQPSES